jgi:hypothetical protein
MEILMLWLFWKWKRELCKKEEKYKNCAARHNWVSEESEKPFSGGGLLVVFASVITQWDWVSPLMLRSLPIMTHSARMPNANDFSLCTAMLELWEQRSTSCFIPLPCWALLALLIDWLRRLSCQQHNAREIVRLNQNLAHILATFVHHVHFAMLLARKTRKKTFAEKLVGLVISPAKSDSERERTGKLT